LQFLFDSLDFCHTILANLRYKIKSLKLPPLVKKATFPLNFRLVLGDAFPLFYRIILKS
jgi:hypothetical protein